MAIMSASQSQSSAPWSWHRFLRTYALASLLANLVWELVQMPLFTLWREGSAASIAYAAIHCTLGDVCIALAALIGSVLSLGNGRWPSERYLPVAIGAVVLGLGYTAYSEWLNVYVRKSWSYSELMPLVFGLGLSPLLQWVLIPSSILKLFRRCQRSEGSRPLAT